MRNERYYYGIMPPVEKQAYKEIFNGLKARKYEISVPLPLSVSQVEEIYLRVLFDNPTFYYVNQTVIRQAGKFGCYILLPEYLYTAKEIQGLNRDVSSVMKHVGDRINELGASDFELEKYLHDCVVKSVAYDYESLNKSDCFNAHSIIGAFLDKRAVCEGIAKAFKLLCNAHAIKCIVVIGKADSKGQFDEDSYHAWNLVKIHDESYHVDVTWDNLFDGKDRRIVYDYFNLSTDAILRDHMPIVEVPQCTASSLNYFSCTNSIVSTFEDLCELVQQRISSSIIMFRFCPDKGEFLTMEEIEIKMLLAAEKAFQETGCRKKLNLTYNKTQRIGKIVFALTNSE